MVWIPVRCRIPELLHKRGKTQQWLSEQTGISKTQMSDYIRLVHIMKMSTAKLIAEAIGCSLDDLFEWVRREE